MYFCKREEHHIVPPLNSLLSPNSYTYGTPIRLVAKGNIYEEGEEEDEKKKELGCFFSQPKKEKKYHS